VRGWSETLIRWSVEEGEERNVVKMEDQGGWSVLIQQAGDVDLAGTCGNEGLRGNVKRR
jgi:hypothetical protein